MSAPVFDLSVLSGIATEANLEAQVNAGFTALYNADVAEATARAAADATLQTNITAEAAARAAAVTALEADIAAEATARGAAVTALEGDIADEATARAAADTTLQTNIDAEEAARIAAVSAEVAARGAAVSAEEAARQAADIALQAGIDAEVQVRAGIIAPFDVNETDVLAVFENTDSAGSVRQVARVLADGSCEFREVRGQSLTIASPPYPLFEQFEINGSVGDYVLLLDTDANGVQRIAGFIPAGPAGSNVPSDDIRHYAPTIDQTGTVDVSATIKAVHDAAAADGLTTLYLEAPYLAPSAIALGNVHFRTRTGKGRLIGTYRKHVIPASVGGLPDLADLIPARHLARFTAAVAAATPEAPAVVVYMSDSWGNPNQLVGLHSQFEFLLRRALRLQYGEQANRILVVNRAIGGTTWDDAAGVPSVGYSGVTWAPNPALPWLDYVTTLDLTSLGLGAAVKPHLCLAMFGMNHGTPASAGTLGAITTVIDALQAISPQPDVVLIAGTIPSTMHPTRGTKAQLEARLSMAGLVRSEAAMRGLGLADFGRFMGAVHWGQDERRTYFRRIAQNTEVTWPYTWPNETVDFAGIFEKPGATDTFWTTGTGVLSCTLSSVPGNRVELERDSGTGNVAVTVYAGTGVVSVPRFVTSVAAAVGVATPRVEICAQGPHLTVRFRGVILWDGPVHRGGGQHAPVIGFSAPITLNAVSVAVSEFMLVEPSLTATDLWGATNNGELGGNGAGASGDGNHLSEPGRAAIFAPALLNTRWS